VEVELARKASCYSQGPRGEKLVGIKSQSRPKRESKTKKSKGGERELGNKGGFPVVLKHFLTRWEKDEKLDKRGWKKPKGGRGLFSLRFPFSRRETFEKEVAG